MRCFFDTEFLENGATIELISIGVVREDGAEYYAETTNAHELACSTKWLEDNVFPHLDHGAAGSRRSRFTIAHEILDFAGEKPEFWAWYADYDWVALCQLYGRMIELPNGWPMYCRDFKQHVDFFKSELGRKYTLPPKPEKAHNALEDARWLAQAFESHMAQRFKV